MLFDVLTMTRYRVECTQKYGEMACTTNHLLVYNFIGTKIQNTIKLSLPPKEDSSLAYLQNIN